MGVIIRTENISFAYDKDKKKKNIFDKVSFTLEKGDFFLLTGANGSGKSTFLKILVGLLPVQGGEIFLWSQPLRKFQEWKRIGYLSQKATSFNFNFPATVEEILKAHILSQRRWCVLTQRDKQRITDVLDLVGLTSKRKSLMGKLSGGQQQRVFIARALILEPELLLLDEPNAGIDQENAAVLAEILRNLNQEKQTTILLIAHNWSAFDNLAVMNIEDGKLICRRGD